MSDESFELAYDRVIELLDSYRKSGISIDELLSSNDEFARIFGRIWHSIMGDIVMKGFDTRDKVGKYDISLSQACQEGWLRGFKYR